MASDKLVSLKDGIKQLYLTNELTDCEFEFANKQKIRCHKYILGVASPVFKAMLFGDLRNIDGPERIEEMDPAIFKKMIEFIYTEDLEFDSVETACSVYTAGEKYILPYLQKHCEHYLLSNVNASSLTHLLDFIKIYENENIYNECINYIRSETRSIIDDENFLQLDLDIIKIIVEQPALDINEIELFEGVEKWAANKAKHRGIKLSEIVPEVSAVKNQLRFLSMSGVEYAKGPGISEMLSMEEQRALALNIHSCGVCDIPNDLCSLRKPRPPRVKYQYKFTNFNNITSSTGIYSPEFFVKTMKWKLQLMSLQVSGVNSLLLFNVVLVGDTRGSSTSCIANIELKILPHKKGYRPFTKSFKQNFRQGESSVDNTHAVEWSEVFDKNGGYFKDNMITVEASVQPDPELED